jgi:hypothetical protein
MPKAQTQEQRKQKRIWFANHCAANPEEHKAYIKRYMTNWLKDPTNQTVHQCRTHLNYIRHKVSNPIMNIRVDTLWHNESVLMLRRQMEIENIKALDKNYVISHCVSLKELVGHMMRKKIDRATIIRICNSAFNLQVISRKDRNEIERDMFRDTAVRRLKKAFPHELGDFV